VVNLEIDELFASFLREMITAIIAFRFFHYLPLFYALPQIKYQSRANFSPPVHPPPSVFLWDD
jgi:hypothetical protein